jgi:hypothetical protein
MLNKKYLSLLKIMKKMKGDDVSTLLDFIDDSSVDSVCECVFNVINTDLQLSNRVKKRLKKHITQKCNLKRIKMIANRKIPVFKRRRALKMEGKGLPLILASIIPTLISLFTRKKHN